MSLLLLLGAILAHQAVTSHATCDKYWTEYDGSCYRYFHGGKIVKSPTGTGIEVLESDGRNQTMANAFCQEARAGASLVTLNSRDESDFLYGWILTGDRDPRLFWIGLYIELGSMTWRWFSGENVTFTNWEDPTEAIGPFHNQPRGAVMFEASIPNQAQGVNTIDVSSQWGVEESRILRSFICEYTLPTATNSTTGHQSAMLQAYKKKQHPEQRLLNNFGHPGFAGLAGSRLHEVVRGQRYRYPPTNRHDNAFVVLP